MARIASRISRPFNQLAITCVVLTVRATPVRADSRISRIRWYSFDVVAGFFIVRSLRLNRVYDSRMFLRHVVYEGYKFCNLLQTKQRKFRLACIRTIVS